MCLCALSSARGVMDIYEDTFKLHEMIDSDIRTELEELQTSSQIQDASDIRILTALAPAELLDNSMDSESSNWLQNSNFYGVDIDIGGGILVNPQTGVPIGLIQPQSTAATLSTVSTQPISTSPTVVITQPTTLQITHIVTPQSASEALLSNATILQHVDGQRLNITVPVPTPSPSPKDNTNIATCVQTIPRIVIQNQKASMENNVANLKGKPKGKTNNNNNKNATKQDTGMVIAEKLYPKPAYSYSCLIAMALKNSITGSLPVNEIYNFMIENFPYFKTAPNGWKNSVRHNLSLNKCFEKIEQPVGNGSQRKSCLWAMNPAKVGKMDEELQKWSNKDRMAIRRSMANPEQLSILEKGQLKKQSQQNDDISTKNETDDETETTAKRDDALDVHTTIKVESPTVELPPLEGSMNLDASLNDLQKGIWEELCDDRLQFLNDTLSPCPSPATPNNSYDKEAVLSDAKSLSFVRGNYIYSQADSNRTVFSTNSNHQVLLQSSAVENKDKMETKCNS